MRIDRPSVVGLVSAVVAYLIVDRAGWGGWVGVGAGVALYLGLTFVGLVALAFLFGPRRGRT